MTPSARRVVKRERLDTFSTLVRMGEVQLHLIEIPTDHEGNFVLPKGKNRMRDDMPPQLRKWLTRMSRMAAHITWCVRLICHPEQGGQGELVERARAGDRTLVLDTARSIEYMACQIADDVETKMRAKPTDAAPGTPDKVAVLAKRQRQRQNLFSDGDAGL